MPNALLQLAACDTSKITVFLSSSLCIILVSLLIRYPLSTKRTLRKQQREQIPKNFTFYIDIFSKLQ